MAGTRATAVPEDPGRPRASGSVRCGGATLARLPRRPATTIDSAPAQGAAPADAVRSRAPRHPGRVGRFEDALVALALAALVLLPLLETASRIFLPSGPISTGVIVQHLTLAIGMAGGA